MADPEVEETLREIRERVRAEHSRTPSPTQDEAAPVAALEMGGGRVSTGDALSRVGAHLATTERAWDKLPPLMSNRSGWVASFELWIKRQVKRATHWFTWEQVNFNSAVKNALRDALSALEAHERLISQLEARRAESESRLAGLEARLSTAEAGLSSSEAKSSALEARLTSAEARLTSAEARVGAEAAGLHEELAANVRQLRAEQSALAESVVAEQRAATEALRGEQRALADDLRREQDDRAATRLDEQHVCFRQLSLESSESAVMADRARRQLEARLAELEKAVGVNSER